MSETPSELFDRAEIPAPTEREIRPCTCGLAEGAYNMGQFHLVDGEVVGWCHEYRELAAGVKRGTAALRGADPFSDQSQHLAGRVKELEVRLDELKRGGANR